jgi:adenylyltransferase/sulfurtransferase
LKPPDNTRRSVSDTRFALIGAGGLGGPLAYALAAADAGQILLCDYDLVELSNLQRQVQFTTADIGRRKVEALADELVRRGYPRARLRFAEEGFTAETADGIVRQADVVIDASDNFETKFRVNDCSVAAGVPCVISAVLRYGGQVLAVRPGRSGCYRCLFEAPPDGELSCAEAGVLGAAVAVIGGFAARAALELARNPEAAADTGAVAGELFVYEDLRASLEPRQVRFHQRPNCAACAT